MSANLKIKNFQSIKDAEIDVEGLTILVGESSQGKSACLRAVNAACNNKFKQNFLRYGTDTISVAIDYGEGSTLEITKTKKESPTYKLGDLVFQKLNRTIPDEVNDFNNFGIIDYFETKYPLNYFSQFAKPLLLEFSQKRILEILSSSKAYDDMNVASTNLNKHKEQNNGAFKQLSSMLSDNKNQLSELKKQKESIEGGIMKMRECQSGIEKSEGDIEKLDSLINLYNQHLAAESRLDKLNDIDKLCAEYDEKVHLLGGVEDLNRLLEEYDKQKNRITCLENKMQKIDVCLTIKQKIDSLKVDKYVELENNLNANIEGKKKLASLGKRFELAEKAVEFKNQIRELDNKANKLNNLTDLMSIAKATQEELKKKEYMVQNRICPICGKPM